MKKLTSIAAALATLFVLTGCPDDKPVVVHDTHVVHVHHHDSDSVNPPSDNSAEGFNAVERPASYSSH